MIYQTLAEYYDALVQDEEAYSLWRSFVQRHITKGSILELACGSGNLAISLAHEGYAIDAMDISEEMLAQAKAKDTQALVNWSKGDMRNLSNYASFDGIVCFCDSLNYLLKKEDLQQVFQEVYAHLKAKGVFLFDVHAYDRLSEFAEEYCESGHIKDVDYQWTILAEEEYIYQTFLFYDDQQRPHMEQHIQRVYPPLELKAMLEEQHFQVTMYMDFDCEGIQTGEKYFFVCRKEGFE